MVDYLQWESELSLEHVFSDGNTFSYPAFWDQDIIYLSSIKSQKSRSALMLKSQNDVQCITPTKFNLRTKINEYGGKPYWLIGDDLFFVNQADQCLYWQSGGFEAQAVRISPKPENDCLYMFSDVVLLDQSHIIMICEKSNPSDAHAENNCFIASLDFKNGNGEINVIEQGADFYSNLVYSRQSNKLAWVQWNHPSMPWDETQAYVADIALESLGLRNKQKIPLQASASVCQLCFANNGDLFLSADFSTADETCSDDENKGFWNIYCFSTSNGELKQVTELDLEFGYPHWQYGDSRIVQYDQDHLLTIGSDPKGDRLFVINQNDLTLKCVKSFNSTLQALSSDGNGRALMVELPFDGPAKMLLLDNQKNHLKFTDITNDVSFQEQQRDIKNVSVAQHFQYTCRDGNSAYGFYYPPKNDKYKSLANPPPLIVMVHGGPTARAYGHYDVQKQFWTSRGFALFDVNHRGSSGYGRNYRDALYSQWGELDCSDIVDGINSLVEQSKADPERICIRGKSAGGYAVLRALTQYPDVFKVGACYYGIGNLATLAESTHKFEKYYTDRLIGEKYQAQDAQRTDSLFFLRSPIHEMKQLKSSMIVFQGGLDNVVPPKVAHEIIDMLKLLKLDYEYCEYPDEAHGFRQVENNIDAWTKELAFYRKVLG